MSPGADWPHHTTPTDWLKASLQARKGAENAMKRANVAYDEMKAFAY